jgi:hypothetical protein
MWQKNSGDDEAASAFSVFHPTTPNVFYIKKAEIWRTYISRTDDTYHHRCHIVARFKDNAIQQAKS